MHIAELAWSRKPDHLYRCDTLPPNRAYWFCATPPGPDQHNRYIRPDGSTEPFEFALEANKYRGDETWSEIGIVPRTASGEIDLTALQSLLSNP